MKCVGGRPCLDFVNTVGGWSGELVLADKLETYSDLVHWAELTGIPVSIPSTPNPRKAAEILARARALRLSLHRLLNALIEKRTPAPGDLSVFIAEFAGARDHQKLIYERGKFHWGWNDAHALEAILWRVSQSAADLLTSPDLDRVRRCAGETCGWMFLDTTRNHSRHWCDMKDCGNLAKVRRFRERRNTR